MVTLEQLVQEQKLFDMTDIQVIKMFFDLNDLEEEGIEMITELSKTKVEKLKHKHNVAETWICMLPSKYLYEHYDLDIADKLHNLELNYLVNGGELSGGFLDWARENVPNIVIPRAYFNPLIDYLEENGVRFKDR